MTRLLNVVWRKRTTYSIAKGESQFLDFIIPICRRPARCQSTQQTFIIVLTEATMSLDYNPIQFSTYAQAPICSHTGRYYALPYFALDRTESHAHPSNIWCARYVGRRSWRFPGERRPSRGHPSNVRVKVHTLRARILRPGRILAA